jgi:hypothetical protein
MATIQFKAKAHRVENADGTLAYMMIDFPKLTRSHCDMAAFRQHPRYGGIANSDLFPNALSRIASDIAPAAFIRTDRVPDGVDVDLSGFLARVTIEV